MFGIFLLQLDQVDHQGGQQRLAHLVGLSGQIAGKFQSDGSILLVDLHRGLQPQHVIHGALGEANGAGDGGTEDVFSCLGQAGVPLHGEGDNPATVHCKGSSGHQALIFLISTLV